MPQPISGFTRPVLDTTTPKARWFDTWRDLTEFEKDVLRRAVSLRNFGGAGSVTPLFRDDCRRLYMKLTLEGFDNETVQGLKAIGEIE